jgi:MoaA/NifB/PqqE/SkfB family radical SAM enzyme
MCDTWRYPTDKNKEIRPVELETLPQMVRLNITGGEPFLRDDLGDILSVAKKKAKRVVISSNGVLTKRTLEVMSSHRDVGIRLSFDGLGDVHDSIRGVPGIHHKALETLRGLKGLGIKDLGIAVTISDKNATDLVPLYNLAQKEGVELATAVLHNAYYFHKEDNRIDDKPLVDTHVKKLVGEYLCSSKPKDWFRGYFTNGIADHIQGRQRPLKCTMATDSFFVDPYGNIRPCNVMDFTFGNIREKSFAEIWDSPEAREARKRVCECKENCWMIGSVGHLMRQQLWTPFTWIIGNKWFKRREAA